MHKLKREVTSGKVVTEIKLNEMKETVEFFCNFWEVVGEIASRQISSLQWLNRER